MAKDPAFLLYYQDFLVGCDELTNEETGAYIRCLCMQAAKGGLTEKHMINICQSHDVHNAIKSKFVFNSQSKIFENLRLKTEIEKRKAYSLSRSNNRNGGHSSKKNQKNHMKNISKSYVKHMENENEIENTNTNVDTDEDKKTQKKIEIVLPFESDNFKNMWNNWKQYKKEQHRYTYKHIGEQAALKKLAELSAGNEQDAIEIIMQSIAAGWKGLFNVKQNTNGKKPTTREQEQAIYRDGFKKYYERAKEEFAGKHPDE